MALSPDLVKAGFQPPETKKSDADSINSSTVDLLKEMGLSDNQDAPDLTRSDDQLFFNRKNRESFETWTMYDTWKGKRMRSKEPLRGERLTNGQPKFMWIKVSNIAPRFLNLPVAVAPGPDKDFKPTEPIPVSDGTAMAIAYYNQLDPENPETILLDGNKKVPIPASIPAATIAKHFQIA